MVNVDARPFPWPFTATYDLRATYTPTTHHTPTPPPLTPEALHPHPHIPTWNHAITRAPAPPLPPPPLLRPPLAHPPPSPSIPPPSLGRGRDGPKRKSVVLLVPERKSMPFVNAALLEGHRYGVGKLRSVAFQRRIDDLLEVLRSKMAAMKAQVEAPCLSEFSDGHGLGVNIDTASQPCM